MATKTIDLRGTDRVVVLNRGKMKDNVTVYLHYAVQVFTDEAGVRFGRPQC